MSTMLSWRFDSWLVRAWLLLLLLSTSNGMRIAPVKTIHKTAKAGGSTPLLSQGHHQTPYARGVDESSYSSSLEESNVSLPSTQLSGKAVLIFLIVVALAAAAFSLVFLWPIRRKPDTGVLTMDEAKKLLEAAESSAASSASGSTPPSLGAAVKAFGCGPESEASDAEDETEKLDSDTSEVLGDAPSCGAAEPPSCGSSDFDRMTDPEGSDSETEDEATSAVPMLRRKTMPAKQHGKVWTWEPVFSDQEFDEEDDDDSQEEDSSAAPLKRADGRFKTMPSLSHHGRPAARSETLL